MQQFPKGSPERLLELMGQVNKDFKPFAENQIIRVLSDKVNEDEPEVDNDQPEVSKADIEASNKLDAEASTAVPAESDNEKPVINSKDEKTVFTVPVPTYKKSLVDKNVQSMKKLAKKLGLPEPTVTYGQPYQTKVVKTYDSDELGGLAQTKTFVIDVFDVTVDTTRMYRLNGDYNLIAVVDNKTGGSIETDPTKKVPVEYLAPSEQCDLCHQERYRGKCFVVNDKHGDFKRLGSSCVKKYLGIDPSKFIKALAFMTDFKTTMGELGDEEDRGGGGRGGWSVGNLLTDYSKAVSIIYDIIKRDGFEKKLYHDQSGYGRPERSNEGKATSEKADRLLLTKDGDNYPVNQEVVKQFTEYLNALQVDPNKGEGLVQFFTNLKDLPNKNVRVKDTGILAAGVNMFLKHLDRIAKDAVVKDSQWLGQVGEKVKIPMARLEDVKTGEGAYGTWYLWTLIDGNGNLLKKFGQIGEKFRTKANPDGENLMGFNKGDEFAFTAEIKNLDTYNNVKSTMLGRLSKL